jgi:concanavalin A-like lectin/glucanase superfamily protein
MYRLPLCFCLLILTAGGSIRSAELIGHWDFATSDGKTARDVSGHSHDAAILFGRVEKADNDTVLALDGYIAHGEIPATRSLALSEGLTLAAWIHPTRLRRNSVVFGKPNTNPAWTTPTVGIFSPEDGRIGLGLWTSPKAVLTSPEPLPLGTWSLVAGTYDNRVARLYINGRLVAEQKVGKPIAKSTDPFMIGTGTAANRFFGGLIGELRLYDGAIPAPEVQSLYEAGVGKYPSRPVATEEAQKTIVVRSKSKPDREWRDYPTRTLDLLEGYTRRQEPVGLSKYGGWLGRRFESTGFFRTELIDGRWWLIDPEGYRFIHVGVVSVHPGSSANMRQAFGKKFGDNKRWAIGTTNLLEELHFNGTGGWTDHEMLGLSGQPMPYVVRMGLMSGFGRKLGVTHAVPGHTGFELECIPVFHPDFSGYCHEKAKALAAYRDDPYVVGIYSDNELQTPKLENYLKLDASNPAQRPNYEAAVAWLQERKGKAEVSADDITMLDRLEFAGYVFERYFRTVTEAIRKVDPNHLYIGSRFMGSNYRNPFIWKAAEPYCDVVAVNYYSCWGPRLDEVAYWQTLCRRPIMITEFYVKGEDSGLPNTTGAGWIVPTQADRGRFYQHYALGLLESRACVGWHWFKYQDNDPEKKGAELSNIDSNKGIVDIRYEPYTEFVELMKEINREVYPLTQYFDNRD